MRSPERCSLVYCGYKDPFSPDEIKFEILGLETAIIAAKQRIAELTQAEFLAQKKFAQQIQEAIDEDDDHNSSQ